jgi:phosphate-selective porin OprO/OprP
MARSAFERRSDWRVSASAEKPRSSSEKLVDTGPIEAGGSWALGVEAGAQWRELSVQGEYYRFGIEREGVSDPGFVGWYVQAAWTLTGEPRRYRVSNGSFDVPEPRAKFGPCRGRWGVLELGLRYSDLNLNKFDGRSGRSASTVRGGEQRVYGLVLNWQPEEHVRLQGAIQQVETRRLPEEGLNVRRAFHLFSLRSQFSL